MSDTSLCPGCDNKGWRTWCPICKRTSSPHLELTPAMLDEIHRRHTEPPDDLDLYWRAQAALAEGPELSNTQDELIKNGATYSFLALCVKLLPVIAFLAFAGWAVKHFMEKAV